MSESAPEDEGRRASRAWLLTRIGFLGAAIGAFTIPLVAFVGLGFALAGHVQGDPLGKYAALACGVVIAVVIALALSIPA